MNAIAPIAAAPDVTPAQAYALFAAVVQAGGLLTAEARLDHQARQAQAGNLAARDALYSQMEAQLRRVTLPILQRVHRLGSARLDDADVAQQLFVLFCALLTSWQPQCGSFAAHLHAAARTPLIAYVRRCLVLCESDSLDLLGTAGTTAAGHAPDPAAGIAADIAWHAALTQLDHRSRCLVQWHLFDDQPLAQAAARLGLTRRHAYRLLATARATLRAVLTAEC